MHKHQITVLLPTTEFYFEDGQEGMLLKFINELTGSVSYKFVTDAPNGIGGNMDSNIKRFHGWRGTTNNISCHALGWRRIDKIMPYNDYNFVKVKFGKDLRPNCD